MFRAVFFAVRRRFPCNYSFEFGLKLIEYRVMKNWLSRFLLRGWCAAVLIVGFADAPRSQAQGVSTRLAYEGSLSMNGVRANGNFDFTFTLYDAAMDGNPVGTSLQLAGATVTNGSFGAILDFRIGLSQASSLWLELAVRPAGGGGFTVVPPRQSLAASPFAIHAVYAANLIGSAMGVTLMGNTTNANVAGNSVAIFDGNRVLTNASVTPLELSSLAGSRGDVQGQLDAKLPAANGAASNLTVQGTLMLPLARPGAVAVFDNSGTVTGAVVSATELSALAGIRSSVQMQLDGVDLRANGSVSNLTLLGRTVVPGIIPNRVTVLNANGVLTGSVTSGDELAFLSGLRMTNVKAPPYLAAGDGVIDDTTALQSAFDDAAAGGGGLIFIPQGIYKISASLMIGSKTRVVGAGRSLTVIRGGSGPLTGRTNNLAEIYANIAMVAADRSSVENLTVDNRANGTLANGIALLPDGAGYSGTPCTRCAVLNCEVLGFDSHQYLIWNFRGRMIRIAGNYCDGGVTDVSGGVSLEGIECYGGEEVVISQNTILNVGLNAINLASTGDIPGTSLRKISVTENVIRGCFNGVWVNTSRGPTATNNIVGIHVANNFIEACANSGFYFSGQVGTAVDDLVIQGNCFQNLRYGVYLFGGSATVFRAVRVAGNSILNNGQAGLTMGVVSYGTDNSYVGENSVSGFTYGVVLLQATNHVVMNNKIEATTYAGIYASQCASLSLSRNFIQRFNLAQVPSYPGMIVSGLRRGMVSGNLFSSDVDLPGLVVDATSSLVGVKDNQLLYNTAVVSPFSNYGAQPNTGVLRFPVGATVVNVENGQAIGTARILVSQEAGSPLAVRAEKTVGGFRVTLARAAVGDEIFRYEILL